MIEFAHDAEHAADIRHEWLNGADAIPCDEITLEDGTRIVTFICDESGYHLLAKRTLGIRAVYGNVEPAIVWAYREYMKGTK